MAHIKNRGGRQVTPAATPLTIRQMEAMRKENAKKAQEEMQEFELDLYLTPKRPMKSVPKLAKALSDFFQEHMDDPYISPNLLAQAVGYADEDAMLKDAFSDRTEPKYAALLRMAYSKLEDIMTAELNAVSLSVGDSRGIVEILKRMDKKRDKYDPDSIKLNETPQQQLNIINIRESEEIKDLVSGRISALLGSQGTNSSDVAIQGTRQRAIPAAFAPVKEA